jgi:hypothetical protein
LHWFEPEALAAVYAQVGAILLNGDKMPDRDQEITELQNELVRRQVVRAGVAGAENW